MMIISPSSSLGRSVVCGSGLVVATTQDFNAITEMKSNNENHPSTPQRLPFSDLRDIVNLEPGAVFVELMVILLFVSSYYSITLSRILLPV